MKDGKEEVVRGTGKEKAIPVMATGNDHREEEEEHVPPGNRISRLYSLMLPFLCYCRRFLCREHFETSRSRDTRSCPSLSFS